MPAEPFHGLASGFLEACRRFPDRPALELDGAVTTYAELGLDAARLAGTLAAAAADGRPSTATDGPPLAATSGPPLTAVWGVRSHTAYAGILAALLRGHGYVPLHPEHPPARTRAILERSGCRELVCDAAAVERLDELVAACDRALTLVLPGRDDVADLAARWPRHRVIGARDLAEPAPPAAVDPSAIAYLLFTSGSTGVPKGVMVSHANALHFLRAVGERYRIDEHDRTSQLFDPGFDLSVFDLFAAWGAGACSCVPEAGEALLPAAYVERARLTTWFSVPSTAVLLKRLGVLEPGAFPGLRLSLFCGEALTAEVAEAWAAAAPRSVVENLYGPTEATIACTAYRWDPAASPAECESGVVPIGTPLHGTTAAVVDPELREVAPGGTGELLVSGPQVALGYWRDPERTARAFLRLPGREGTWYRTGDRVRRPLAGGPLRYLGRTDHQLKLHGFRVEPGEVEAVLREAAGVDVAVALGWPRTEAGADGIVAFLEAPEGAAVDAEGVLRRAAERLPRYMVPRELRSMARLPLNANGKVDLGALLRILADDR